MKKLLLLLVSMSVIAFADVNQKQVTGETIDEKQTDIQPINSKDLTGDLFIKPVEQPNVTYQHFAEKETPEIVINEERVQQQQEEKREIVRIAAKEKAEQEAQAEQERLEQERLEREQAEAKEAEQITAEEQPEPEQAAAEPTEAIANVNNTLLAQIVHAEANGEPYSGKVAVAEVIINRTRSGEFPNTVEGVVYQPGQFSPVSDGSINNAPNSEDYAAVQEALNGSTYAEGSLYFYNPEIATSRWLDTLPVKVVIGGHHFK